MDVGKDRGVQCVLIGDPNNAAPEQERAPAPVQVISVACAFASPGAVCREIGFPIRTELTN